LGANTPLCDSRGWPQRSQSGEPAQRGQARSPSSSATSRPSEEPQYRQRSHIHASSVGTRCSLSARCDSSGSRSAHVDRCRTRLWRRERRRLLLQPRPVPLEATRDVVRRHLAQLRQRGNDSAPRTNHPRAAADRHTPAFVAPSPRRRSEADHVRSPGVRSLAQVTVERQTTDVRRLRFEIHSRSAQPIRARLKP
jgi:hypothetical protein